MPGRDVAMNPTLVVVVGAVATLLVGFLLAEETMGGIVAVTQAQAKRDDQISHGVAKWFSTLSTPCFLHILECRIGIIYR